MTELPKELPILTPDNMYIGAYNGPNGTHCLSGWVGEVHGTMANFTHTAIYKALAGDPYRCSVCVYNDTHTLEENADLWNRTAESLGYIQRDGKWVLNV